MSARSVVAAACAAVLLGATPSPAAGVHTGSGTTTLAPRPLAAACTSSAGPGIAPPASVPAKTHYYHAAWYGQSGYLTLCPGDTATATVAIYNSGEFGWVDLPGQTAYLGTTDPSPGHDQPSLLGGDGTMGSPSTGWSRYNRMAIQPAQYVGPGQVAWFQFNVKAPLTPGTYRLHLRPLIEGLLWMEDLGIFWVITVPETQPAEQFGLITKRGNDFFLRTETDATVLRPLAPPTAFNYGLDMRERAPDGRHVAYWVETGGMAELHVTDVPAAKDTIVARFPNRAGTLAWSTDGTGILASIGAPAPQTQLANPRTLVAVTVATGQIREVYQAPPSDASLVPLIWRNAPELFAAYEKPPGGFDQTYTVIRPGQPVSKGEPGHPVIGMQGSFDGSYAFWIDSPIIHAWPSHAFQLAYQRTGGDVGGPKWWPRLSEVVYERGSSASATGSRIERWDPFTGALTTVKDIPAKRALGSFIVRTDGSAIITQRADGLFELTDLATGQVTPVPTVTGEVIFGSIVLK